jgi:uncharacterized membrane protein
MSVHLEVVAFIGIAIDLVGVLVIVAGVGAAGWQMVRYRAPSPDRVAARERFQIFRQDLARAILLGLEFLIAGDIIRTVAVTPTLSSVTLLGLIVLIRTFLSITLHLEVEGRWPWQKVEPVTKPARTD